MSPQRHQRSAALALGEQEAQMGQPDTNSSSNTNRRLPANRNQSDKMQPLRQPPNTNTLADKRPTMSARDGVVRRTSRQPSGWQCWTLLALFGLLAALASANELAGYQQQQQHYQADDQQPSQKAKKIQIVYIKVPLAKLKPSLSSPDHTGTASESNSTYAKDSQGSPTHLLGSSTSAHASEQPRLVGGYSPNQAQNNQVNSGGQVSNQAAQTGGSSGAYGPGASSSGTSSSTSYGASGPNQPEFTSGASGYSTSTSAFSASGPSSGYGSGTSTFGASAAFSDYPAAQSTYGAASQQHPQRPHQLSQSGADSPAQQRLRQAKKTIIPIVVQVEHAILEHANNQQQQYGNQQQPPQQPIKSNKYSRGHRQLGNRKRNKHNNHKQQPEQGGYRINGQQANHNQVPYGAATGEHGYNPFEVAPPSGAQMVNAANAHDINQITAQINAENAAAAANALAQADAAFASYAGSKGAQNNHQQQHHHQGRPMLNNPYASGQYASNLHSAASMLLSNTHPVIQAAASGGLASVSKLGAKLGEMIALPSVQVPNSIASISQSLPSALSSITNQMGAQLNQAVQQVAKEHPAALALTRQVAQQAGIQLPNLVGGQSHMMMNSMNANNNPTNNLNHHHQPSGGQLSQAASSQHAQAVSPQAQLQNLKLSIGQNLQTAAASLMGINQGKAAQTAAQTAASLLANPLSALYPPAVNAALKQISSASSAFSQQQQQSAGKPFELNQAASSQSSEQQLSPMQHLQSLLSSSQLQQQPFGNLQTQQAAGSTAGAQPPGAPGQAGADSFATSAQSALLGHQDGSSSSAGAAKGTVKSSSFKSKFISFFQPPKFISNLLSWNDRADERQDESSAADESAGKATDASDSKAEQKAASKATQDATPTTSTSTTAAAPTTGQALSTNSTRGADEQTTSRVSSSSTSTTLPASSTTVKLVKPTEKPSATTLAQKATSAAAA